MRVLDGLHIGDRSKCWTEAVKVHCSTEIYVDHPYRTLWNSNRLLTAPLYPDFPSFVIGTSSKVMKSFVMMEGGVISMRRQAHEQHNRYRLGGQARRISTCGRRHRLSQFNPEPGCKAATAINQSIDLTVSQTYDACVADEASAEQELQRSWSKYSAADKRRCVGQTDAGGMPSYVEVLECILVTINVDNPSAAPPQTTLNSGADPSSSCTTRPTSSRVQENFEFATILGWVMREIPEGIAANVRFNAVLETGVHGFIPRAR